MPNNVLIAKAGSVLLNKGGNNVLTGGALVPASGSFGTLPVFVTGQFVSVPINLVGINSGWVGFYQAGSLVGSLVQSGTSLVVITPPVIGTYTLRLYTSNSGGRLLAETIPVTVTPATPRGGGRNSNAFTNVPNLRLWWDMSSSLNSGSIVSDLSGNGNDGNIFGTTVLGYGNQYQIGAGGLNDLVLKGTGQGISCNKIAQFYRSPSVRHCFLVCQVTGYTEQFPDLIAFGTQARNGGDYDVLEILTSSGGVISGSRGQDIGNFAQAIGPAVVPDHAIFEYITYSSGNTGVALNGQAIITSSGTYTVNIPFDVFSIGCMITGVPTAPSYFDNTAMLVSEFAIVDRVVTGTERNAILSALNTYRNLGITIAPVGGGGSGTSPSVLGGSNTLNYLSGALGQPVNQSISVADGNPVLSAKVQITSGLVPGVDILAATPPNGSGIVAFYTPTTGILNLTGSSTALNYQSALRSVVFSNVALDATAGGTSASRQISFTATDAAGTSPAAVTNVSVAPPAGGGTGGPGGGGAFASMGPLKVRAGGNGLYLSKPSGSGIYLAGSYILPNLQDLNGVAFGWTQYLAFMQANNMNCIRLNYQESPKTSDGTFSPLIYARSTSAGEVDGGNKFDLNVYDPIWTQRLHQRCMDAAAAGIYVIITHMNGVNTGENIGSPDVIGPSTHPWLSGNNVSGVVSVVAQSHTEANASDYARRIVDMKKIVDTINDMPNVIHLIGNKLADNTLTEVFRSDYINALMSYQAGKPNQHPIIVSSAFAGSAADNTSMLATNATAYSPAWGPNGNTPPLTSVGTTKPVFLSTGDIADPSGFVGSADHVADYFMRGNNYLYLDDGQNTGIPGIPAVASNVVQSVMTWDPTDVSPGITYSNGNKTYTWSGNGAGFGGARGTVALPTNNNYYFELTMQNFYAGTAFEVGIATKALILGDQNNDVLNGGAAAALVGGKATVHWDKIFQLNGYWISSPSGGTYGRQAQYLEGYQGRDANAGTLGIAVNRTTMRIWFRSSLTGNWNDDPNANPATSVNGRDISTILPGLLYAYVCDGSSTGPTCTINGGAAPFRWAPPTGFLPIDQATPTSGDSTGIETASRAAIGAARAVSVLVGDMSIMVPLGNGVMKASDNTYYIVYMKGSTVTLDMSSGIANAYTPTWVSLSNSKQTSTGAALNGGSVSQQITAPFSPCFLVLQRSGPNTGITPPPSTNAYFSVSGGQIIDPLGKIWKGQGVAVYDAEIQPGSGALATQLMSLFPGLKVVRVANQNMGAPSTYSAFTTILTNANIVVVFEHHDTNVTVLTGAALTAESAWYSSMATFYKSNPYVMFGTMNEPATGDSAQHQATYNAIRNTGNNTILFIEAGTGADGDNLSSITASVYAAMSNVAWDIHSYNWQSSYSTNSATILTDQNNRIALFQGVHSADGVMPVACMECGNSTNGTSLDAGGTQQVQVTFTNTKFSGTVAWIYVQNTDTSTIDNLTNPGGTSLNSYGNQVAGLIAGSSIALVPGWDHIVVVIEENHTPAEITAAAPYINSLIAGGASMTNYKAITHPSEPNYFALYAGNTFGISDDNNYNEVGPTIASALKAAGKSFVGYVDAGSPRKHNPWESFAADTGVEQPFINFPTNFSNLPSVSFVIPNLNNDMHDGTVQQGDAWLQSNIKPYADWAKTHNSVLVVVGDEDDGSGNNTVLCVFYGANVTTGNFSEVSNHYNLCATICAAMQVPAPATAATSPSILTPWVKATVPPPVVSQNLGTTWMKNTGTPLGQEPNQTDFTKKYGAYFYPNHGNDTGYAMSWEGVYDMLQSNGIKLNSCLVYDTNTFSTQPAGQGWAAPAFAGDPRANGTSGFCPMSDISITGDAGGGNNANFQSTADAVIAGNYDNVWRQAIQTWKDNGFTKIKIRLSHEFNGTWYDWCVQKTADIPKFISAFRHVVPIMKSVPGIQVDILWNPAVQNHNHSALWAFDMYPGDDVVDSIAPDMYSWGWYNDLSNWNADGTFAGTFSADGNVWASKDNNRLKSWNCPNFSASTPAGVARDGISLDDCYRFARDHGKIVDWPETGDAYRQDFQYTITSLKDDALFIKWAHDKIAYWHKAGVYTGFWVAWYIDQADGSGSNGTNQPGPTAGRPNAWAATIQAFSTTGTYVNYGLGVPLVANGAGYGVAGDITGSVPGGPPVIIPPPVVGSPPDVTLGSGTDIIKLVFTQDYYLADCQFTITVDGSQIGGVQTIAHNAITNGNGGKAGSIGQNFFVKGTWPITTSHTVSINFLNDAYGGSQQADANLFLISAAINGAAIGTIVPLLTMLSNGPQQISFGVAPPGGGGGLISGTGTTSSTFPAGTNGPYGGIGDTGTGAGPQAALYGKSLGALFGTYTYPNPGSTDGPGFTISQSYPHLVADMGGVKPKSWNAFSGDQRNQMISILDGSFADGWFSDSSGLFGPNAVPYIKPCIGLHLGAQRSVSGTDIWDNIQTQKDILAGAYDSIYTGEIDKWLNHGYMNLYYRLGYELNSTSMPDYIGSNVADNLTYAQAFRHVIQIMKARAALHPGAVVRFGWNPLVQNSNDTDIRNSYPGDDVIDVIDCDIYSPIYHRDMAQWDAQGNQVGFAADEHSWVTNLNNRIKLWDYPGANQWTPKDGGGWSWQQNMAFAKAHGKTVAMSEGGTGVKGTDLGINDDYFWVRWLWNQMQSAISQGIVIEHINIWNVWASDGHWVFSYLDSTDTLQPNVKKAVRKYFADGVDTGSPI